MPQQSSIAIDLNANSLPRIEVDWGTPPQMEVAMTFAREVQTPQRFAADEELLAEFGDEFSDLFETSQTMKVEYEPVGVPSEIKVIVPNDTSIKLDTRELDQKKIESKFIDGLRVTDKNIINIVDKVLIDFNDDIVQNLKKLGSNAVSFHPKKNNIIEVSPERKELGFVGIPNKINSKLIN